ncbi:MAG TPA: adenylate/guanylate cyclase domain-containing protein [Bacteroidia bacterium]|nr:adenylate/guanylate cyclase domain-containing protein [Bacteroidia bacterium]HRH07151.1 adenylate/guanylate cyclase domain-containing protein [Bacteroidia bacterium]HRH63432.1 adenylate/guanylate cyclase domain-containing protein [Bacteroidia bacterium]
MNRILVFCAIFLIPLFANADDRAIDSLKTVVKSGIDDTTKVNALNSLCKKYLGNNPQEAIKIATEAKELAEKTGFQKGKAYALKNIGIAYYTQGKYIETLDYWQQSEVVFKSLNDKVGVANILSNIGVLYFDQGDNTKALELYLEALKLAEETKDTLRIATSCINIGAVYFDKPATHDKARQYYLRALPLSENNGDNDLTGTVAVNLGEIYLENNQDDSALYYFEKSLKAYEGSPNIPYSLTAIGKVWAKKGDYDKAIGYQQQAYETATKLESKNDITISLIGLAQSFEKKGDSQQAQEYYLKAEEIAKEFRATLRLKEIYEGLSTIYAELSDFGKAFKYQQLLINIKDTIYNIDVDKKLGTLQFGFDIQKKEGEINLLTKDKEIKEQEIKRQKIVRNGFIGGFAVVLLFAAIFLRQRNRISKEKQRSEELLLNILPSETAEELKATGAAKAKSFDNISVLFTDFKNFTRASELLSAEELVKEINYCYSEFDRIITKYGIEKIKTIGDAYMCAGGLPVANTTHPFDVVKAGLEMVAFIEANKQERIAKGQPYFELRLGIHSGPVVAGIVGIKKFAYDIWGDTVNTASRMESSGETGKVNISGTTYELIKDRFKCTYRGKIQAKNKGEIDMYFVEAELT